MVSSWLCCSLWGSGLGSEAPASPLPRGFNTWGGVDQIQFARKLEEACPDREKVTSVPSQLLSLSLRNHQFAKKSMSNEQDRY